MNKPNLKLLLLLLASIAFQLKSQVTIGDLQISTCFQKITDLNGKKFKLLKSNGEKTFTLTSAGGTSAAWGINIIGPTTNYTLSPNLVTETDLVGDNKDPVNNILEYVTFYQFPQEENGGVKITIPTTVTENTLEIRMIREFLYFENGQPKRYVYFTEKFEVEFIDESEIEVDIVPTNGKSCLTFDDYAFDLNFLNLDGMCVIPTYKLTSKSQYPGYLGLPLNWESIPFSSSTWPNIPANCANEPNGPECTANGNEPEPVPCKCINFDLEIKLDACNGDYIECPTIVINRDIKICCSCDVRPPVNNN